MVRLSRIIKNFAETGALNEKISLFGFIDDHTFLTKGGDLGIVLAVEGIDYECLDHGDIDHVTKRLQQAFRLFDPRFRVYQYLFKNNNVPVPLGMYESPVVEEAIRDRAEYFRQRSDKLYSLRILYVVMFDGVRLQGGLGKSVGKAFRALGKAFSRKRNWKLGLAAATHDLGALFGTPNQTNLVMEEIDRAHRPFLQRVENFILQLNDLMPLRMLDKSEAFRALRRLVNFDPMKLEHAKLKYDVMVDQFLVDSAVECHPTHLKVDDYFVQVLTLKEPTAQSWPLIFKQLYEVEANYHIVTEWKPVENTEARKHIQSMRRHFHNSKTSIVSQATLSDTRPSDVLVDDSKAAMVQNLGDCLKEIELNGNYFGRYSLTVVLYHKDLAVVEKGVGEFYKVFSMHDGAVHEERFNLDNAFFSTIPGNSHYNLRQMYLLNTNYADYSFLFTLHTGARHNAHLDKEYLALLETRHKTLYFLNLHYHDVAHTLVTGKTGAGKSFLLNFLVTNAQKYAPYTYIFDLGGSFRGVTELFGGTYLQLGVENTAFKINPFVLEENRENLNFLQNFVRILAEGNGGEKMTPAQEKDLYVQIQRLYRMGSELRTLSTLASMLDRSVNERLERWLQGGQYGFVFDNAEDNLTFAKFQCFDFQGMERYPQLIEPLLFYILHRANNTILDAAKTATFKLFLIDEAWRFFKHDAIKAYIIEAIKSWRKKNAAMVLATQSLDELRQSDILNIVVESCPTKIFLANPDMDRDLYREAFHLNEREIETVASLIPKREFMIKRPDGTKVVELNVPGKSYWLYTNNPKDNVERDRAIAEYGFKKALEILAARRHGSPSPQFQNPNGDLRHEEVFSAARS